MKIKSGPLKFNYKKRSSLPQSKLLKSKQLKPSIKTVFNNKNINESNKHKFGMAINETGLTWNITKPSNKNIDIRSITKGSGITKIGKIFITPKVHKTDSVALKSGNAETNIVTTSTKKVQNKKKNNEKAHACDLNTSTVKDKGLALDKVHETDSVSLNIGNAGTNIVTRSAKKAQNKEKNNEKPHACDLNTSTLKYKGKALDKVYEKDYFSLKIGNAGTNIVRRSARKAKNHAGDLNTRTVKNIKLDLDKVTQAVSALLKLVNQDENKKELLDLPGTIFMDLECIKIPVGPTKQLRFKLPHPFLNELSDVLLITADKKGAKIYPEKAVEYYTELLAKHDINFIQKIIPLRTLKMDYSQYEMRRKLVDQFDMILADAKIIKSLPARLGKFILFKRKMPIPVQLNRQGLKQHLLRCLSKTQMTVRSTGHKSTVQVGHTNMAEGDVAKNILAVTGSLNSFPGGWNNIRSLDIKTAKSASLPLYLSLASPDTVETPVEKPKVPEPVVGELSTQVHAQAVVYANGEVELRTDSEYDKTLINESENKGILEEIKTFRQLRKTIHDEPSNDSDEEANTIALEKKMIRNYQKTKQNNQEENEEDKKEEEAEESSDEDDAFTPIVGQKRKNEERKNKKTGKTPNEKKNEVVQQKKLKGTADKKEVQNSMQKDIKKRGSRGGKKKKLNKSQRKGMLKKKKAGKK